MRTGGLAIVSVLVLALCIGMIVEKEAILREGRTIFLRLAPVDPRSLIQGDYMHLRYAIRGEIRREGLDALPADGFLVVRIDENKIAHFARLHKDERLAQDEHLLRFRRRNRGLWLGAESYFFEEGTAPLYADAVFGELRVAPSGEAILIGLRDEHLRPLGPDSQSDRAQGPLPADRGTR